MPRKQSTVSSLLVVTVIGLAGWRYFSHQEVSMIEAEQIAARHLVGKSQFSPEIPVEVRDTGETYEVFFTFNVPEGADDGNGQTYKSYVVVQKKDGEVLELGVLPPAES